MDFGTESIHNAKTDELGEEVLSMNFKEFKILLSNLTPQISKGKENLKFVNNFNRKEIVPPPKNPSRGL